jgi:hypothetical protein
MKQYAVILSHADQPGEGMLCYVAAESRIRAQDECNEAVSEEGGVFEGCVFTIWPEPSPV